MLKDFYTQRVKRGLVRRFNNLKIARMAYRVSRISPPAEGAPVVFFLKGIPVAYFACNTGMSKCVLGTNRDNPQKGMPCKSCVAQSRAMYAGVQADRHTDTHVNWFGFERDPELDARISSLTVSQLSTFHFQDFPLGPLCLPALRWVLRIHHLKDDEDTRYLLREYILSAWNVAREFSTFLDKTNPRAVIVF
ncbi:MAG: hypothetical protein DYG85_18135, partial [Chloroflexi bacterium CFX1]|nr:hypothetical protein [Chloroflexi bacterium CFX1]